jgi:hypothetical protein
MHETGGARPLKQAGRAIDLAQQGRQTRFGLLHAHAWPEPRHNAAIVDSP